MSRIGKKPVTLPAGVKASMQGRQLVIEKGNQKLTQWIDPAIQVEVAGDAIVFQRSVDERRERALHGLYRSLADNMVEGLTKGFEKRLKIEGVGFGAALKGKVLELNVGYADGRRLPIPDGVNVQVPDATTVIVTGIDKQKVGQFAAEARQVRPPEPYKGKGVRYHDEVVKRKQGKTVGAGG